MMEQLKKEALTFSTAQPSTLEPTYHRKKSSIVVPAYMLLFLTCLVVRRVFSDKGYSSVLTLGAGTQFFGFMMLIHKVHRQKSVAGISRRSLETYALVLMVKLTSTLFRQGYLPVDRSGDWVYQLGDIASLAAVLHLMIEMHTTYKATYQEEYDTLDVTRCYPICVLMAIFIHGDLNNSFVFDTIWTLHMNLDTVAMIPQLWLIARLGEVEGMTSHWVFCMVFSRACSFSFWFYGFRELKRGNSINLCGWQLVLAHAIQLLLATDFLYYYMVSWYKQKKMVLPTGGTAARVEI